MAKQTVLSILALLVLGSCADAKASSRSPDDWKREVTVGYNELTEEEERILVHKGTEMPFSGEYNVVKATGTFVCRRCNAPLYRTKDKFDSNCGWPSFDDEIEGAIRREVDADGRRTEILCKNCGGHLGHVFNGEQYTVKNTRHCVNSLSIRLIKEGDPMPDPVRLSRAIFASGCFWGTEHLIKELDGVIATEAGYIGGHKANPTYREVCSGTTGHAEAVEVIFDASKVDYETLAKRFFETHDPTQVNRQGPDVGTQYRSEIFVMDDEQRRIANDLIAQLEAKGLDVATKVTEATEFWPAENYHQDYYQNNGQQPYCHRYVKRF